jgi:hypothetical protein
MSGKAKKNRLRARSFSKVPLCMPEQWKTTEKVLALRRIAEDNIYQKRQSV